MSDQANIIISLRGYKKISLDVELQCHNGETLVLFGPSGSGKTTVLRAIAGLHTADAGSISVNDHSWFHAQNNINLPPQQRTAGLMFQEYALFPHKTALQNLILSLQHKPKEQRQQAAKKILKRVHLSGLESRYPHQLSGGQKQRVALARALAKEPEILLLDEPFSSVDHLTKRKLVRELSVLKHELKMPIVMVTHDLDEARVMADRICVIHHGKTLQQGVTEEILKRPKSKQVAKLLGMNNIFEASIKRHIQDKSFTIIEWQGKEIEATYQAEFKPEDQIDWVIPAENIILHRKEKPSQGEKENPVNGIIKECLPLGETTYITAEVNNNDMFSLSVPTHVANRNQLKTNESIQFSLLANAIHIMQKQIL